MPTRTHSPMTLPERNFWRDAFLAAEQAFLCRRGTMRSPAKSAELAADYADAAVAEYRHRITWRRS